MAVMSVDHPDFLEFIHCKDKEGDISSFNISVGLTDEFMSKVESGDPQPWMCKWKGHKMKPRLIYRDSRMGIARIEEVSMSPRELFEKHMVKSAWKTGEPGCVFLDTVNRFNVLPGTKMKRKNTQYIIKVLGDWKLAILVGNNSCTMEMFAIWEASISKNLLPKSERLISLD